MKWFIISFNYLINDVGFVLRILLMSTVDWNVSALIFLITNNIENKLFGSNDATLYENERAYKLKLNSANFSSSFPISHILLD